MTKKITAFLLAAVMAAVMIPFGVSAAGSMSLSQTSVSANAGDSFSITVSISGYAPIVGYSVAADYNTRYISSSKPTQCAENKADLFATDGGDETGNIATAGAFLNEKTLDGNCVVFGFSVPSNMTEKVTLNIPFSLKMLDKTNAEISKGLVVNLTVNVNGGGSTPAETEKPDVPSTGKETAPPAETNAPEINPPERETSKPSEPERPYETDRPAETDRPQQQTEKQTEKSETPSQPEESGWENPFTDVNSSDGYYDAVKFVNQRGLFLGVSSSEFGPAQTMTRAMFVTVLGRLAKIDTSKYLRSSFTDSDPSNPDAYYAPYVEWAAENGIVLGYGDGRFGVHDTITVEQAVVIISRYAHYCGFKTLSTRSLIAYTDRLTVSDWATEAMRWSIDKKIYRPSGTKLNAKGSAARSLVAELMYGYVLFSE